MWKSACGGVYELLNIRNVVFFILGHSPKERIQHSQHSESLKSRNISKWISVHCVCVCVLCI